MQPLVDAAWLNVRVWLPALANPHFRSSQIAYGARENRDGTKWEILLPRQCWQCGTRDRLLQREYERQLRGFESPVGILVCAGAVVLLLLLLALWMKSATCFLLAVFTALGGAAFMFVKSWKERARLVISTCPEHADGLRCPLMVAYENELVLILPSEQLTEAARTELAAKRRTDQRYSEPKDPVPPTAPGEARRVAETYRRGELPPIKLDE
ncbi:MAG TPA: hypothetical protein VHY20_13770 [Pirellulales bacterium]|nr:hypothetical protein [Pirellulales bacterium]